MLEISLILIVLLVLILPLSVHVIERNLEVFLFFMGVLAVSFSHFWGGEPVWTAKLIIEVIEEPVMITLAVLCFGALIFYFKKPVTAAVVRLERKLGSKLFCFVIVTALGLLSSVITAIIAAIILVEVVSALKLSKNYEIKLVVLGCFSIGLGAALTPIGEPLSTICVAKLRGEPYHADFFFLFRSLGYYIIPGVLGFGLIGALLEPSLKPLTVDTGLKDKETETIKHVVIRALKVYVFINALILLGAGFKPVIDKYVINLPVATLYWINSLSAVVDNATLAAAEISPSMSLTQIQAVLMGLLVAGGMLIPGNIPNIISAGRLGITSKQWAKTGLPLGVSVMAVYFIIMIAL